MSLETFERLPADRKELIISTGIEEFSRKAYKDSSTDEITRKCGISKGILFHYFGSKREYYLYCLARALECLTANTEKTDEDRKDDFYGILFGTMTRKLSVCRQHMEEMRMVNMASRDPSAEIADQKAELMRQYMISVHAESSQTLKRALTSLKLTDAGMEELTADGLQLYINAVLHKYLLEYQQTPELFFENSEKIREEMKKYLDLMLYGICQKEQK